MSYPLDCRTCGGYLHHKADCALVAERDRDAEREHRARMERIARETAGPGRRERIATAALQGIILSRGESRHAAFDCRDDASDAVVYADALIAVLDAEPEAKP